ncbi:MAG: GIY-YIG nuclease family protein [Patescibacteria group bacterium]
MYKIYIIQSEKNNFLYVGLTSNLEIRLKYHNQGRVFSTKGYRSWKLVYTEEVETRQEARKR